MAKVGRPPKFESVEEVKKLIDAYFDDCEENRKPLTITGLALALDTTRRTLLDYEAKEEYSHTIKRAKQMCEKYAEEYLFLGNSVTGAIFNLKNNYGWRDRKEVEHINDPLRDLAMDIKNDREPLVKNDGGNKQPGSDGEGDNGELRQPTVEAGESILDQGQGGEQD